jgi:hypothetical protein
MTTPLNVSRALKLANVASWHKTFSKMVNLYVYGRCIGASIFLITLVLPPNSFGASNIFCGVANLPGHVTPDVKMFIKEDRLSAGTRDPGRQNVH